VKREPNWLTEQMQTTPRDTWVTVDQAAAYLQICSITVIRWIKSGKLPASKIGRGYRIAVADLDAILEKGKVAHDSGTK
jgi:excisionase family DNA binding protein